MIRVIVNGEPQECSAQTLSDLLTALEYEGDWLATAVNGNLVAREERADWPLKAGDRVEILAPMQGG